MRKKKYHENCVNTQDSESLGVMYITQGNCELTIKQNITINLYAIN